MYIHVALMAKRKYVGRRYQLRVFSRVNLRALITSASVDALSACPMLYPPLGLEFSVGFWVSIRLFAGTFTAAMCGQSLPAVVCILQGGHVGDAANNGRATTISDRGRSGSCFRCGRPMAGGGAREECREGRPATARTLVKTRTTYPIHVHTLTRQILASMGYLLLFVVL